VGKPPVWSDRPRQQQFEAWLSLVAERHGIRPHSLRLASADASFRRYFRVDTTASTERSLIIMDAPPALEDVRPFVRIAALFEQAQVTVPRILEWQEETGFLLLSDLGACTLMASFDLPLDAALSPLENATSHPNEQARQLMGLALEALLAWQLSSRPGVLPDYDEALLRRELSLFDQWYVGTHLGLQTDEGGRSWSEVLAPHYNTIIAFDARRLHLVARRVHLGHQHPLLGKSPCQRSLGP
jgi:aminoglycoside/choline kinase family phosphotransferase